MDRTVDVAIVGGGIAGLALAWRLRQSAPHLDVVLLEASERTGGKILSERVNANGGSFLIEGGPDALLAQKPEALALIDELGLGDQVIPIAQGLPATLLRNGQPVPIPAGLRLIAPTRFWPIARSPLFSPLGKARMGLDLLLTRRRDGGDESQAAFVRRRFGQEAVERLGEPILAGIHNGDPERLSMQATFPQLVAMERQHRSIIRGMRVAARQPGRAGAGAPFVTLRDGMATLPDTLARRLGEIVHRGCRVDAVTRDGADYRLRIADGSSITSRQVVLTTPAAVSAALLRDLLPEAARRLGELRAIGAGSVSLAYRTSAITRPLPGYGLVVPLAEGRPINAVTVASRKFAGRASEGWTLLRLFFGGVRSQATLALELDALLALVQGQLEELLGVTEEPVLHRIVRWPAGSPQYDVGHLDRVRVIEEGLPPGLFVTGSPYRGVGIPDVVRAVNEVAGVIASGPELRASDVRAGEDGRTQGPPLRKSRNPL